ncbi:MAG: membrane integrity-associated transporter subunit PqiC [Leptospiraceae bacterium]|nr:membrane integrity-associated transporter subunit PqiC [Leptospiraceae bacterium]MCP5512943.1 membrane integrity-associated transporter subunit PqiC [Leptospiraceae bacterium]
MINPFKIIFFLFSITLLSNCSSFLKKDYPEKKYYLLDTDRSNLKKGKLKFPLLKITKIRISPYFEGKNFVYKQGNLNYETDFYNEFLVYPSNNINEVVNKWIIESGLSVPWSVYDEDVYQLQINVESLHGDFSDGSKPRAILELNFLLQKAGSKKILYTKKFHKDEPITEINADNLVTAWNKGLTEIMIEMESDLRKIQLPKKDDPEEEKETEK